MLLIGLNLLIVIRRAPKGLSRTAKPPSVARESLTTPSAHGTIGNADLWRVRAYPTIGRVRIDERNFCHTRQKFAVMLAPYKNF